ITDNARPNCLGTCALGQTPSVTGNLPYSGRPVWLFSRTLCKSRGYADWRHTMPTTQRFDVVVVGGGSGLTAAYHALQADCSVALVSDRPQALGGTCVNFGCIPTKTLIQAADVMHTVRSAAGFGIELDQA